MSILFLFLVLGFVGLLVVPGIAAALYRVVDKDGYGTRPGPRSHPENDGWFDRAA